MCLIEIRTHLLFYVISKSLGVAVSDCGRERIMWYTSSDKPIACSMSCDWHVITHCFGMIRCQLSVGIDEFKFGDLNS